MRDFASTEPTLDGRDQVLVKASPGMANVLTEPKDVRVSMPCKYELLQRIC